VDLCATESLGAPVPLDGVEVSTLPAFSSSVSADGGLYVACIPVGQPTTIEFTMAGYATTYLAEISILSLFGQSLELETSLACSAAVESYGLHVPTYDANLASVYVAVLSVSGMPPCGGNIGELSGWSFTASQVDGGVGDGGPWPAAYLDPSGTLEAVGSTFNDGPALVYNVDPGAQYVAVHGAQDGGECETLDPALGFTGRIYVAPGAISFNPWIVP
jgi:hypothetical protein